ncbi:MAG TPA: hypothetical protein V6D47_00655 [Oscillatoriaceae cyanobacterium]
MRLHRFALLGMLLLAGCSWPQFSSPLTNFTPYANPNIPKEQFDSLFNAWKAGQAIPWNVHFRGSQFTTAELIINSTGTSSLGAQTFTPSHAQLASLIDEMQASNLFSLYDGHYGAWLSGGGVGGPDITVDVGSATKHVSSDPEVNTTLSWEAGAIQDVSQDLIKLADQYVK